MSKIIKVLLLLVGLSIPGDAHARYGPLYEAIGEFTQVNTTIVNTPTNPNNSTPGGTNLEQNFTAGNTAAPPTDKAAVDIWTLNVALVVIYYNATQ